MAPLPANNTKTYFLDYEGPMGTRSLQMRTITAITDITALATFNDLLDLVVDSVYTTVVFTGVRVRNLGADFSLPVPGWEGRTGGVAGALAPENFPRFVNWVGRSQLGRRCTVQLYGTNFPLSPDFRLNDTEDAVVSDVCDFLEGFSSSFIGIDGTFTTWKRYANTGLNAYYQRKRRQSA